jgi:hypothetical protein
VEESVAGQAMLGQIQRRKSFDAANNGFCLIAPIQ